MRSHVIGNRVPVCLFDEEELAIGGESVVPLVQPGLVTEDTAADGGSALMGISF